MSHDVKEVFQIKILCLNWEDIERLSETQAENWQLYLARIFPLNSSCLCHLNIDKKLGKVDFPPFCSRKFLNPL